MSEFLFLFRFRDLVAKTIEEHQKIIENQEYCWWGWWKRPSEDSRVEIWEQLQKAASLDNPTPVGLFDSGSGKVYRALVTGVIPPEGSAENTIRVPSGQEGNVPSYYRESPFSRAWMRIIKIETPTEFFGKHSYSNIPRLPGYTASTLERLRDKKIVNADELRLMDTTIWEIRQARQDDPEEQILLSVAALPAAVSQEVVRCKANTILHITDLHFAVGQHRDQHVWRLESEERQKHSMVEAVTAALGTRKVGLVIASGDFTFLGSEQEFNEARSALSLLLGTLDLDADHLVIVPGNHDIQWATDETYTPQAKVVQASAIARRNYERFYRQLMRHEPNRHLTMGRRFVLPTGLVLELCALNSSSLATGKNFLAGTGRIDEASFVDVANELGWTEAQSMALRMLVIHHHLALTEDLEPTAGYGKGFGIAVDAVRVQRLAAKKGVQLALHGHKHRSFVWRSIVYELPEHAQPTYRLGELSIIGGGSVGSIETDGFSNYFNLISSKGRELNLEIFRARSAGTFSLMQTWKAELVTDPEKNCLTLQEWQHVNDERKGRDQSCRR